MMRARDGLVIGGLILGLAGTRIGGGAVSTSAQTRQEPRQNWDDYLPPGDGKPLVATACSSCHDLGGMVQQRHPRDQWEGIVIDMVARGAPLSVEEADKIIEYLATVFGPKAPPLTDVNSAGPEELTKLPGVSREAADKLVAHRKSNGPVTSREQVKTILGLEDPAFEKVKWYLRANGAPQSSR